MMCVVTGSHMDIFSSAPIPHRIKNANLLQDEYQNPTHTHSHFPHMNVLFIIKVKALFLSHYINYLSFFEPPPTPSQFLAIKY